jgi:hypothetical protein
MGSYGSPEIDIHDSKNVRLENQKCKFCNAEFYGNYCPICGRPVKRKFSRSIGSFTLGMVVGGLIVIISFIIGLGLHK